MYEILTRTRFINALVREHLGIDKLRMEHGEETFPEYLKLEVVSGKKAECGFNRLVIRGNRNGTYWMLLSDEFPNTLEGIREIHKAAVDIAFCAAEKASIKAGKPVQIGMPPVSYFKSWYKK